MATKTAKKTATAKSRTPAAKGAGKKSCMTEGCKRAYRAKGYCFFHYKKWRRGEMKGVSTRYGTCHKAECKKRLFNHGFCQEHFDAWKASRKSVKLAAAVAAPAANTPPAAPETPAAAG